MFADDTLLFAKANARSCVLIREILDDYCRISGQLVNFHKSAFQCTSNVISPQDCGLFKDILRMDNALSLGKYLGCPVITERVTNETFGEVVANSQNQLSKWKANSLSQAGRTILIQANFSSKASFQMQSFLLPAANTCSLDKINRNFFFGIKMLLDRGPI